MPKRDKYAKKLRESADFLVLAIPAVSGRDYRYHVVMINKALPCTTQLIGNELPMDQAKAIAKAL